VAFAHNRRNKPVRGRVASESGGGVSLEQYNTVNRNRSKSGSSVQQHGVLLGRCLPQLSELLLCLSSRFFFACCLMPRPSSFRFGLISGACLEVNLDQRGVSENDLREIAPVLLALTSLQSLKLSKNSLGDSAVLSLAPVLQAHVALKLMDLSENGISDFGAVTIARALESSVSISSLDLSNNCIGDAGASAIEICLLKNHSLVQLELLGNPISAAAASGVGQALRVNRTIARSYSTDSEGGGALLARAVKEQEEVIGLSDAVMTQQRELLAAAVQEIAKLREELSELKKAADARAADQDQSLRSAFEDARRQRQLVQELESTLAQQRGCGCSMM
jgi:hypothetical protein